MCTQDFYEQTNRVTLKGNEADQSDDLGFNSASGATALQSYSSTGVANTGHETTQNLVDRVREFFSGAPIPLGHCPIITINSADLEPLPTFLSDLLPPWDPQANSDLQHINIFMRNPQKCDVRIYPSANIQLSNMNSLTFMPHTFTWYKD